MIECKPYKAKFLTPTTCIENQKQIRAIKKAMAQKKADKADGLAEIRNGLPEDLYYIIRLCDGCKVGLKHYKNRK